MKIVLFLAVILMVITSCNTLLVKDMNIIGIWNFILIDKRDDQPASPFEFQFSGSRTSGEVVVDNGVMDGTFSLNLGQVEIEIESCHCRARYIWYFNGILSFNQAISGTWQKVSYYNGQYSHKQSGTFSATKKIINKKHQSPFF